MSRLHSTNDYKNPVLTMNASIGSPQQDEWIHYGARRKASSESRRTEETDDEHNTEAERRRKYGSKRRRRSC